MIVAGPNGSGKSSAYRDADTEFEGRSVWIVNPDLLTARIQTTEGLELGTANLEAVVRIERWLAASLDLHKSVGIETVLSTGKYRKHVLKAKSLGYQFWLLYVLLDSPDRNVERVKLRVAKGGHDVAESDIRGRHRRSLEQVPWFLEQADRAWLYDNSGAAPRRIGLKRDDVVLLDPSAPAALREALA